MGNIDEGRVAAGVGPLGVMAQSGTPGNFFSAPVNY